ncbi:MAG: cyclic peptide transporter [Oscillospiraceae bacterium]|jgi:CubicO group peptidase (beta-lactamase class C family)|nr:cyclic peptide transporter [Oscillospiraceae bacterium]
MKKRRCIWQVSIAAILVSIYFFVSYSIDKGYKDWQRKIDAGNDCIVDTRINDYVTKTKRKASIKNVSVTVYRNGESGFLLEGNENKDKLFMIGSMTKAFTGLGIMYLENKGSLSLDDDITKYIPDFKVYFDGEEAHITIDDLLKMKSGFTNSEKLYPSADKSMTLKDWVYSLNYTELRAKPGTEYNYANANYNLLGYIIEVVSKTSYEEFMQDNILKPLNLTNTFCGQTYGNRAVCEGTRLGYGLNFPYHVEVKMGAIPAGYFYSNSIDMSRWLEIWLGKADIPIEYQRLVDKTYKRLEQLELGGYFAGWEVFENGIIGHSGGTENYSSRIIFSRENETGVCVLTNMNAAASTDNLCNQIYNYFVHNNYDRYVMDVWKIFDIIFTSISLAVMIHLAIIFAFKSKMKRIFYILSSGMCLITLILFIMILPLVFQSNLFEIIFIWAPWSMLGGLILLGIDLVVNIWLSYYNKVVTPCPK